MNIDCHTLCTSNPAYPQVKHYETLCAGVEVDIATRNKYEQEMKAMREDIQHWKVIAPHCRHHCPCMEQGVDREGEGESSVKVLHYKTTGKIGDLQSMHQAIHLPPHN